MSVISILGYNVGAVDGYTSVMAAKAALDKNPNNPQLQAAYNAAYYNALAAETSVLPGIGAVMASAAISADLEDMRLNGASPAQLTTMFGNVVSMITQGVQAIATGSTQANIHGNESISFNDLLNYASVLATTVGAYLDRSTIAAYVQDGARELGFLPNQNGTYPITGLSSSTFVCNTNNATTLLETSIGNNTLDLGLNNVSATNVATVVTDGNSSYIIPFGLPGVGLVITVQGDGNTFRIAPDFSRSHNSPSEAQQTLSVHGNNNTVHGEQGFNFSINGNSNVADNGDHSTTTLFGLNNILNLISNSNSTAYVGTNATAYINGSGNSINITGSNSYVVSSGNMFGFSIAGLTAGIKGDNNSFRETANAWVNLDGSNNFVAFDTTGAMLNLISSSSALVTTGTGNTIGVVGNNNYVVSTGNSLTFGSNGLTAGIRGDGNNIAEKSNGWINLDGANNFVSFGGTGAMLNLVATYATLVTTGTGNNIGISGNSGYVVSSKNNITFSSGGLTTGIKGDNNNIYENMNAWVNLDGLSNSVLFGATGATLNLITNNATLLTTGSANTIGIVGNGDYVVSSGNNVTFAGNGLTTGIKGDFNTINEKASSWINLDGANNTVNFSPNGNATVNLVPDNARLDTFGGGNTIGVIGANDYIVSSSNKIVFSRDGLTTAIEGNSNTINGNAHSNLSLNGQNNSVNLYDYSGSTVNLNVGASAAIGGRGNTIGVCGTGVSVACVGSIVNIAANGYSTRIDGTGDSIYVTGSNENVYVPGAGNTFYVSGSNVNIYANHSTIHYIGAGAHNPTNRIYGTVVATTDYINGGAAVVPPGTPGFTNGIPDGLLGMENSTPPGYLHVEIPVAGTPDAWYPVIVVTPNGSSVEYLPGMAPDSEDSNRSLLVSQSLPVSTSARSLQPSQSALLPVSHADVLQDSSHSAAFDRFMTNVTQPSHTSLAATAPLDLPNAAHSAQPADILTGNDAGFAHPGAVFSLPPHDYEHAIQH